MKWVIYILVVMFSVNSLATGSEALEKTDIARADITRAKAFIKENPLVDN